VWVHALADADARCGGKAQGLARLIAAGLPVPGGCAIVSDAATAAGELPSGLAAEVAAWTERIGEPFAVRSSATLEDGERGAAAGVFASFVGVTADRVVDAVRAVWASAKTLHATAYAKRRGEALPIAMGVIVQRFISGAPVRVYTRPPGEPTRDQLVVQFGDDLRRLPRGSDDAVAVLALRAEVAIDATVTGADVELVRDTRGELAIVQARAIAHPPPHATPVPPPPVVLAPLNDGQLWTWDVAHNPDPLSPAQQGLVERVERSGVAPYALRVCGGYLYSAPRKTPTAPALEPLALDARARELEAELARALDEAHPPRDVDEAIGRYVAFYAVWAGELAPLIAAARSRGPAQMRATSTARGSRPSSIDATLIAAGRGDLEEAEVLARLAPIAPAWDVAVPTFGEQPDLVRAAIARARVAAADTPAEDREVDRTAPPFGGAAGQALVPTVDVIADVAERDDLWFARAQQLVRRALLARADELGIDDDDVFWLPLDEIAAGYVLERDTAHRRANAARVTGTRAAGWQMPLVVGGPSASVGPPLQGVGTGGRIVGRVVRYASLAQAVAVGRGDVIVTRAVTPALAVLVVGCAALVSESGHLLDHGAALARELGIPCVVGCRNAWTELADGALVVVNADEGIVSRA
jgi:pyruvate,water dikinase